MSSPSYFFAMFGDPKPPQKDTVESGIYHPHPRHMPFPTRPGDVLLLYCAGTYKSYPMQVPGVGVVLSSDHEIVRYRYLPFASPVSADAIKQKFEPNDLVKFSNRRFAGFWLFEILRKSFVKVVGSQVIVWP